MVRRGVVAVLLALSTGALGFVEMRQGLPSTTAILTYHDMVAKRDRSALWFDCTPDELREQIAWMRSKGAHFVSLDDVYRRLTSGAKLPPHAVAITFADNYEGFYRRAWPILRKERVPVTMFVHTGFVGDRHGRPKMTWEQLRELDRSGLVTIGSQTVTHAPDLRDLSDRQLLIEMTDSKRALESHLGHPVRYVAYPNGKFDRRAEHAAEVSGYLMGFSEEQHPAEQSPSILAVNRYVHTKYRRAIQSINPTRRANRATNPLSDEPIDRRATSDELRACRTTNDEPSIDD